MPGIGGLPENQSKVGQPTTSVKNADGEMVPWDLVRDACNVPSGRKSDPTFLTVGEASKKFKIKMATISARAKREGWRMMLRHEKNKLVAKAEKDWAKLGDTHREHAFKIGHESLKRFKPRAPKNFRELDIADRIARRAAGLENDSVVQQTLVHINEAVEGHAEEQVIEAYEVDNTPPLGLEAANTDESSPNNPDTESVVS
jgi:hypothetical protein